VTALPMSDSTASCQWMRRLVPARFRQRRRRARRRAPAALQPSAAATARQHCRPTALHCRLLTGAGGTLEVPPPHPARAQVLRLPCRQQTSQTCSSLYSTTRVTRPPFAAAPQRAWRRLVAHDAQAVGAGACVRRRVEWQVCALQRRLHSNESHNLACLFCMGIMLRTAIPAAVPSCKAPPQPCN